MLRQDFLSLINVELIAMMSYNSNYVFMGVTMILISDQIIQETKQSD